MFGPQFQRCAVCNWSIEPFPKLSGVMWLDTWGNPGQGFPDEHTHTPYSKEDDGTPES